MKFINKLFRRFYPEYCIYGNTVNTRSNLAVDNVGINLSLTVRQVFDIARSWRVVNK